VWRRQSACNLLWWIVTGMGSIFFVKKQSEGWPCLSLLDLPLFWIPFELACRELLAL
jgi:hypothetical protein